MPGIKGGRRVAEKEKKRYYRKNTELYLLIDKIKLWPSRSGRIHGIKDIMLQGEYIIMTTHCGETLKVRNSRNGRAARWLRDKWVEIPCRKCRIPAWKLEKYSRTFFPSDYGSTLETRRDSGDL